MKAINPSGHDRAAAIQAMQEGVGRPVQCWVWDQAALFPERVAVTLGNDSLTYGGLATRSQVIAERLRAEGIGRGDLVGVFLERSFDLIAAILGILEAGAAYVPLDTDYPPDRIAFMIADTGMQRILSSRALSSRLPAGGIPVLETDASRATDGPSSSPGRETPEGESVGEALAYVMYTSGSTGRPKGVAIPHRGIVRLVREPDFVQITPEDVFLQVSPVSFDASTFEIWGALTNGARLVLMPPGQPSLREIGEVIRNEGVTILWLTAGLFNLMVDERLSDLSPIRQLLAGGDVLSVSHIQRALANLSETRIINGYGPTENTTFTCCHTVPRDLPSGTSVPIGRPIRGTTVHVVDEDLLEVPDGQEGELLTGGLGLALGYWNRPELTAERFVAAPFSPDPDARFYRTGDRCRRLPDGSFEFLGRHDNQIKLRGFRIELGEIESAIRTHSGVRDCVVTIHEDARANKCLAIWVVPKHGTSPSESALRMHAETYLPDHMRPAFWGFLDELPLTPNGKIDRARLPGPEALFNTAKADPPRNEIERVMEEVWRELLGGRPVSVTRSYFELGANSLLVAQAHERLCGRGFSLPLTDLFRFPSIRRLADHLQKGESPRTESSEPASRRAEKRAAAFHRFRKV